MSAALPPYLRLVDTQTGGRRCDVTPVFADPAAFDALLADLAAPFIALPPQLVAGIDALVEAQGGVIVGLATIQMDDNNQTRELRARYRCHTLTSAL
jgi:hypothetical protein